MIQPITNNQNVEIFDVIDKQNMTTVTRSTSMMYSDKNDTNDQHEDDHQAKVM